MDALPILSNVRIPWIAVEKQIETIKPLFFALK